MLKKFDHIKYYFCMYMLLFSFFSLLRIDESMYAMDDGCYGAC